VLALTAALDSVTNGEPVRLADLVGIDGDVTITEDFEPDGDRLADFCGGGTWEHCAAADRFRSITESDIDWRESVIDWRKTVGLTEERIASGLGISTDQLCDVSLRLWKTTFSAERDRIAGPDANAQRKGQVTRQLKAELVKAITDGND
jgi:hypothetical protein